MHFKARSMHIQDVAPLHRIFTDPCIAEYKGVKMSLGEGFERHKCKKRETIPVSRWEQANEVVRHFPNLTS